LLAVAAAVLVAEAAVAVQVDIEQALV